ncbi:hypothetical protein AJ80_08594 [Polytolypa hystricis UAMH7299]|uniref:Uncharacterized protein n=1 Tax=Polytolypa hystricis (strain UAMH7299) TaxID=1447883 RepID=A0A2B7X576_POLH7|nr:hypothetical protein AJ80_08594 [Polytolypa hystricis UAMH7299]
MSMSTARSPKKQPPLPKQPLSKPKPNSRPANPSANVADIQLKLKSSAPQPGPVPSIGSDNKQKDKEAQKISDSRRVIEFDSSCAPQPFLDGEEILRRMRAIRRGQEG